MSMVILPKKIYQALPAAARAAYRARLYAAAGARAATGRGYPFPLDTWPPDVPADIQALAEAVDADVARMVPTGVIVPYAGSTAPAGWLLCQGQAVSRTTYADLFAVCGTAFGVGDGNTTFNLPNSKGRVIAGVDSGQTEFATLGKTGGAKTHTLTAAETPAHAHTGTAGAWQGINPVDAGGNNRKVATSGGQDTVAHTITNSIGGGGAHNNLQPYLALPSIIKT